MSNNIQISEFYNTEYINSALYQAFRTIGNYVDGLKPGGRKAVYVCEKFNIKDRMKVSSIASKCVESAAYLHGNVSVEGTITGLAQTFIGSNSINLLFPDGNFGTRFEPTPSASRYIYTYKSQMFDKLFRKEDKPIVIKQMFEGEEIEPKYYIPIVPLILVNGNSGIGNGFAQNILPRSKQQIIKELKNYLEASLKKKEYKFKALNPYYKGFLGDIKLDEITGSWKIYGKFEKVNSTNIKITEVPIGYDLQSYLKVLNKLVENNIIKDYHDKSEDDKFLYIVNVTRDFSDREDERIYEDLKLVKRECENFTCVDENNAIREFKSETEIFQAYIKLRLAYYSKRKEYLVEETKRQLLILYSKWLFIKGVIDESIKVSNKPKENVVKQLEKIEKISKVDDSYDYLLNMSIYTLTKEKADDLRNKIDVAKEYLKKLVETNIETMWLQDLKEIE